MAGKLPPELVTEILSLVLHVPNKMFHDVEPISPFFHCDRQPASSALEVCKTWMKAATPLLYQVVILRSKAQANALERTLRVHKELGVFIKKLRVEGGFGASMRTIIDSSPNIRDLCLSLLLRSSDNVQGLMDSLATLRPTRLSVLHSWKAPSGNSSVLNLAGKIRSCIESWCTLVRKYHIHEYGESTTDVPNLDSHIRKHSPPWGTRQQRYPQCNRRC